jgi:hypothetical protein
MVEVRNNLIQWCNTGMSYSQSHEDNFTHNNIITDCTIGVDGPTGITVEYSCLDNTTNFQGGAQPGQTTLQTDPLFADFDYHLGYNSLCINGGNVQTPNDPDGSINDMGLYGGDYAWEPYYVLIPSTATNFNVELEWSTYKVECNIIVDDDPVHEDFRIDGNATLLFIADRYILVEDDGELHTLNNENTPIDLMSWEDSDPWIGIIIESDADVTTNIGYVNLDHAHVGIECNNITLDDPITDCEITNCSDDEDAMGIYLNESDTKIDNCYFNECNTSIGMYHSNAGVTNNVIYVTDCGIDIGGGSSFILGHNVLHSMYDENIGIRIQYGEGLLDSNIIHEVDDGIVLINSSPLMRGNLLHTCEEYGLFLSDGSQPVMTFEDPARNCIRNSEYEEIHILGHLYPLIDDGGNDIYDDYGGTIIQSIFDYSPQYTYDVQGNFWNYETPGEVRSQIEPDNFDNYTIDVSSVSRIRFTTYSNEPAPYDSLLVAIELENDSLYSEAYSAYQSVITQFPNHPVTITALSRLYTCAAILGEGFSSLYSYYQQLPQIVSDSKNLFYLHKAEARALCGDGFFSSAITLLSDVLETVDNVTDSVFVLMDIANVEYEMSLHGSGLNSVGRNSWKGYNKRIQELQELLENSHQPASITSTPQSYQLYDVSPNPFNSTTTIKFSLSKGTWVNLMVYDISGRQVAELINQWKNAGEHQASFTADRLTSGIYICRLSTGKCNDSKKLVLLK